MLRAVDDNEKVIRSLSGIPGSMGGNPNKWFLTEDGLYEILMLSRKPVAKQIKREVKRILRDIRPKGGYLTRRLDEDERGTRILRTPSGEQDMTVINESGLFNAILGSSRPEAKNFKKWVTSEVLPAIRRHGLTSEKIEKVLACP